MFEIRHILVRMRQGDSDRALAKAGLIGRPKAKALRLVAEGSGLAGPGQPLAGRCGAGTSPWSPAGDGIRAIVC